MLTAHNNKCHCGCQKYRSQNSDCNSHHNLHFGRWIKWNHKWCFNSLCFTFSFWNEQITGDNYTAISRKNLKWLWFVCFSEKQIDLVDLNYAVLPDCCKYVAHPSERKHDGTVAPFVYILRWHILCLALLTKPTLSFSLWIYSTSPFARCTDTYSNGHNNIARTFEWYRLDWRANNDQYTLGKKVMNKS